MATKERVQKERGSRLGGGARDVLLVCLDDGICNGKVGGGRGSGTGV